MWIDQEVPNDQPRKLYFHGASESIDLAVALVKDLIETAPVIQANKIQQNYSESGAEDGDGVCSAVVDCPIDRVGLLIGRKGWVIKKIMQESGAQVSINQSVREGCDRKIIISGSKHAVMTAEQFIIGVIKSPVDTVHDFYNMVPNAPPAQFGVTKNFAPFIPPNSAAGYSRFNAYTRTPNMPPMPPMSPQYSQNNVPRPAYPTAKGVLAAAYAATNASVMRQKIYNTHPTGTFQHPMTAAINANKMSNGYSAGHFNPMPEERHMYGSRGAGMGSMGMQNNSPYMHMHNLPTASAPPVYGHMSQLQMEQQAASYNRNNYGLSGQPTPASNTNGMQNNLHLSQFNYGNYNAAY